MITRPIALAAAALLLIPIMAAPPAQASSQESFTTPGLTAWTVPGGVTELTVTATGGEGGGNSAGGGSVGPTGSTFTSGSNGGAASTAGGSGRVLISYSSSVSPTAPSVIKRSI